MGYYTSFWLTTDVIGEAAAQEIHAATQEHKEMQYLDVEAPGVEYTPGDEMKWYSHEQDMLAFSKRFPTVLFTLVGEGEENEDMWRKYFRDGKAQFAKARVEFEDFDPKKLK